MSRVLLNLIPLLLPFAVYGLYLVALKRAERHGWSDTPWAWLFASGLVLMILCFVIVGLNTGAPKDKQYVPPHLQDGKIVPSQVR